MTLKPEHRELLTPAELQAVTMQDLGYGYRWIARHLGISTTAVRDRLDRAAQKIANHLDNEEAE